MVFFFPLVIRYDVNQKSDIKIYKDKRKSTNVNLEVKRAKQ